MKNNYYVKITDKDINFKGDTPEEKEANRQLFHTTLELNRYQDMTQEVLDYINQHLDNEEIKEVYDIIKSWCC